MNVHGPRELAKKVLRKKLSSRDENRHLDIKREVNFRVSALVERYQDQHASKKKSWSREKAVLRGIGNHFRNMFVREITGADVERWYRGLLDRGLSEGTAARHFNVIHHMLAKASAIWSKDTGIDRNPADLVEVKRPNDQRDRYLDSDEVRRLRLALDSKAVGTGGERINHTFRRLRLIVLIALTTGMRISEVFGLRWSDVLYREQVIAVQAKLKGGRVRYTPLPDQLAVEFRRYPVVLGQDRIFPPEPSAKQTRQRVDRSFETVLRMAGIEKFRFHDLRHTFASWYMMNGGDLYELAKILGHSNIKMTERYAKLARSHIAKTGNTAGELWKLMEGQTRDHTVNAL